MGTPYTGSMDSLCSQVFHQPSLRSNIPTHSKQEHSQGQAEIHTMQLIQCLEGKLPVNKIPQMIVTATVVTKS